MKGIMREPRRRLSHWVSMELRCHEDTDVNNSIRDRAELRAETSDRCPTASTSFGILSASVTSSVSSAVDATIRTADIEAIVILGCAVNNALAARRMSPMAAPDPDRTSGLTRGSRSTKTSSATFFS